jgi:hypothetical protein
MLDHRLFRVSLRHMDVLPFLIKYVIENEEKQKSHCYFSCLDHSWVELFRASLEYKHHDLFRPT